MLGATLDYLILRSLAHRRNLATERDLDLDSTRVSDPSIEEAKAKLRKLVERFQGRLPIDPGLRYLDLGCGRGELTIAFTRLGVESITGVDFLPRHIARARACASQARAGPRVRFVCEDLYAWRPDEKFDVVISFDALEHVADPRAFLRKMADFMAPGGVAVLAFGPLFHSPFGDHMWDFFRLQIPWRGILFSEEAVLRLRTECFRPTDPVRSYHDVAGGLNLMRYSEFVQYIRETGWEFDYLAVNTFLQRRPLLQVISDALMRIPVVRDYLAHNVYAVVRRAAP